MENGGGYDDFLHKLAEDTGLDHEEPAQRRGRLRAGHRDCDAGNVRHGRAQPRRRGFNEHVWYSPAAMSRLADALAEKLGALEPASAGEFTANAAAFKKELAGLEARLSALKATAAHGGVAVTEPVPLYLLEAAGLENRTPAEYTRSHRSRR